MTRREYRFSGFGGQGVITMSAIVGRAASIHDDLDATMTEAYGPEKTGGFSRGDVVVATDTIDYPAVIEPDLVVGFAQDAFERDADSVRDGGAVIVEQDLVEPEPLLDDRSDVELYSVPAVDLAEDVARKLVANIVMLGAVVELMDQPSVDAVRNTVRDVVPEGTEEMNERAFDRGREALGERMVEA
ncbi:MAG: 2-oxoacid:acceptor oxidoreductase family protein [Halanaeroarchaeum sp.]